MLSPGVENVKDGTGEWQWEQAERSLQRRDEKVRALEKKAEEAKGLVSSPHTMLAASCHPPA